MISNINTTSKNLKNFEIDCRKITILDGNNGAGKSSILESINFGIFGMLNFNNKKGNASDIFEILGDINTTIQIGDDRINRSITSTKSGSKKINLVIDKNGKLLKGDGAKSFVSQLSIFSDDHYLSKFLNISNKAKVKKISEKLTSTKESANLIEDELKKEKYKELIKDYNGDFPEFLNNISDMINGKKLELRNNKTTAKELLKKEIQTELEIPIEKLEEERKKSETLNNEINDLTVRINNIPERLNLMENINEQIDLNNIELKDIKNEIGKITPTGAQKWSEDKIKKKKDKIETFGNVKKEKEYSLLKLERKNKDKKNELNTELIYLNKMFSFLNNGATCPIIGVDCKIDEITKSKLLSGCEEKFINLKEKIKKNDDYYKITKDEEIKRLKQIESLIENQNSLLESMKKTNKNCIELEKLISKLNIIKKNNEDLDKKLCEIIIEDKNILDPQISALKNEKKSLDEKIKISENNRAMELNKIEIEEKIKEKEKELTNLISLHSKLECTQIAALRKMTDSFSKIVNKYIFNYDFNIDIVGGKLKIGLMRDEKLINIDALSGGEKIILTSALTLAFQELSESKLKILVIDNLEAISENIQSKFINHLNHLDINNVFLAGCRFNEDVTSNSNYSVKFI